MLQLECWKHFFDIYYLYMRKDYGKKGPKTNSKKSFKQKNISFHLFFVKILNLDINKSNLKDTVLFTKVIFK